MVRLYNKLYLIILWGSCWGITEATVGYMLHMLPIKIGWVFWYPIAFYFMKKVYDNTKNPSSILYIAIMSSGIKLLNLLLPIRIDRVINPAVSILLEAIVLFAAYYLIKKFENKHKALFAVGINTGWRVLYIFYILAMPKWMVEISPVRAIAPLFEFLVVQNLITSIIIYLYIRFEDSIKNRAVQLKELLIKSTEGIVLRLGAHKKVLKHAFVFFLAALNIVLYFI